MAALTVWKFETVEGAGAALSKLESLSKQQLITIEDAAVVYWEPGKKKPKTHQAQSLTGVGALGGAFWGMLIGLLFFAPWLGLAIGAASGALGGALTDTGVDDKFIKEVGNKIEPGHSALFLMVESWTEDKVLDEISGFDAEVLQTSLSHEDEAKLKAAFGAEE